MEHKHADDRAEQVFTSSIAHMRDIMMAFDRENSTAETRQQLVQTVKSYCEALERELEEIEANSLRQAAPDGPFSLAPRGSLPVKRFDVSVVRYAAALACSQTMRHHKVDPSLLEAMNNLCVICSQEFSQTVGLFNTQFVSVMNPCQHVFHFDCILDWFHHRQQQVCPMCRGICESMSHQ